MGVTSPRHTSVIKERDQHIKYVNVKSNMIATTAQP